VCRSKTKARPASRIAGSGATAFSRKRGGKGAATIAELARCNWPRTASIIVQAAVTLAMLAHAFRPD